MARRSSRDQCWVGSTMTMLSPPCEQGSIFCGPQAVQGSPLSPLLSNIVLDELDKELERRGLEFCRFADDCNIFVRTPKAAERVMRSISDYIEKRLKLVVNQDKSQVARSDRVLSLTLFHWEILIRIHPEVGHRLLDSATSELGR